jgi:hypothetical protein
LVLGAPLPSSRTTSVGHGFPLDAAPDSRAPQTAGSRADDHSQPPTGGPR